MSASLQSTVTASVFRLVSAASHKVSLRRLYAFCLVTLPPRYHASLLVDAGKQTPSHVADFRHGPLTPVAAVDVRSARARV